MKRQQYDVTQNSTVTINLSDDQDLELLLVTAGTGGYAVTFAGVDEWISPTGNAPAQPTAVGRAAEWVFFQANGTTYGEKTSETGAAGSAGADGPAGITWRGTYSAASAYAANDAVGYAGSSYIALQDSSSANAQQPDLAPTYWDVLAAGGSGGGSADSVDSFVRADNANISTGAPFAYTVNAGTFAIVSNQLAVSTTTHAYARVTGAVPTSADQHCQVTLAAITINGNDNVQWGPSIRNAANGVATRYEADLRINSGVWSLRLHATIAGADNILGTLTHVAPVAGDTMKLTAIGSTITLYYNGVQKIQVTDTSIDGTTVGGTQCGVHLLEGTGSVAVALNELRFGS